MSATLPSGTPVHLAVPASPRRGLVIVPDIAGLRPLFTEMCDRLAAEHDWAVAAFEPWPGREELTLEERLASVGTLERDRLVGDVHAAADALGVEPVAVMGFCMGGMVALEAAAAGRVDRAVSFYGMVRLPEHWRSATMPDPLDAVAATRADAAPILYLVGTKDPWVPAADAEDLEDLGVGVVRYEGADHGFVHDPSRPAHRADDAADAWSRVEVFLSAPGAPSRRG